MVKQKDRSEQIHITVPMPDLDNRRIIMDYRNLESTQATIVSYLDAFNKMREYCKDVEPTSVEYNGRSVLPTSWRPVGGFIREKLRKDANYLQATHAKLLEDFSNKAKYLAKGYWDWDSYFKVSWQLLIPFKIFAWEMAHAEYIDDRGKTIPYKPAVMAEWCSPQYLCLGEISSWAMKSWALPDWWVKHAEIESFMDDNPLLKDKYRQAVADADKEVKAWQSALQDMNKLTKIFGEVS